VIEVCVTAVDVLDIFGSTTVFFQILCQKCVVIGRMAVKGSEPRINEHRKVTTSYQKGIDSKLEFASFRFLTGIYGCESTFTSDRKRALM